LAAWERQTHIEEHKAIPKMLRLQRTTLQKNANSVSYRRNILNVYRLKENLHFILSKLKMGEQVY